MKPKWIIEKDMFQDGNPEQMIEILKRNEQEYELVGWVPFSNSYRRTSKEGHDEYIYRSNMPFSKEDCVVVYGSINFCNRLYNNTPWTPTAWWNLPALRCSSYYSHWGKYLLQEHYVFMPFGEFKRKANIGLAHFPELLVLAEDNCFFIRPDANLKSFTGQVVPLEELSKWLETTQGCYTINPEALVVIARPRNIMREWRCLVRKGEIVCGSLYKKDRIQCLETGIDAGALAFARTVAQDEWQPDSMYILDIAECNGEFYVLEVGSVNAAGLYKCNIEKVVNACNEQAIEEWQDINV